MDLLFPEQMPQPLDYWPKIALTLLLADVCVPGEAYSANSENRIQIVP